MSDSIACNQGMQEWGFWAKKMGREPDMLGGIREAGTVTNQARLAPCPIVHALCPVASHCDFCVGDPPWSSLQRQGWPGPHVSVRASRSYNRAARHGGMT